MELKKIATIYTDFPEKFGIPRQSGLVDGARGRIVFEPEYRQKDALRGIEEFSHLWVIWGFSECVRERFSATARPPRLGGKERMGVFATRAPYRPNPIALSCVRLECVREEGEDGAVLYVAGVDMKNETPIYDIKPYLPYVDAHPDAVGGFGERVRAHRLEVVFPRELAARLPEGACKTVSALLAEDPRPAYVSDETRVWGMACGQYNVRFTVTGTCLTVTDVEKETNSDKKRTK